MSPFVQFNPNKTDCNKLCSRGNPNRGYLCACTKCKGSMHGTSKITLSFLEEIVDRKLMDPAIKPVEWNKWQQIMLVLMQNKPRNLRRKAA